MYGLSVNTEWIPSPDCHRSSSPPPSISTKESDRGNSIRIMMHRLVEKMLWKKQKRTYYIKNDKKYMKTRDVSGPEVHRKKRKH